MNHETDWVRDRISKLEPAWRSDYALGRERLETALTQSRQTQPRRNQLGRTLPWPALAAAAAACALIMALPQTRALAQQLWVHYVLNRVDVVRVDFSDLPLRALVTSAGPPQLAQSLEDAEQKAGFRPYLPEPGTLPSNPTFTVIGAMSAVQTIHTAEFQAALNKAGAGDIQVPAGWEGLELRANIGPIVSLAYPDNVGILEAKPIELAVPAGFPLHFFAEAAFRSIGRSGPEARTLAQRFMSNPAWLMGIPADEEANVEQVSLRKGTAMLIEDANNDDGSAGRISVLRSTSDGIYCVLTNSRQLALKIAEALP